MKIFTYTFRLPGPADPPFGGLELSIRDEDDSVEAMLDRMDLG